MLKQSVAALEGDLGHTRFGIIMNSVRSRLWLGNALAELGDFAEGIAYGEEAVQIAEAPGHLYSAIAAQQHLGILVLLRGDLPQAMVILERALAHCRATDLALFLHTIVVHLGLAYALSGRIPEALRLFESDARHETPTVVRLPEAVYYGSPNPSGQAAIVFLTTIERHNIWLRQECNRLPTQFGCSQTTSGENSWRKCCHCFC